MSQDLPLELAQALVRLEAQIGGEHATRILVGGERIGLPAKPVQRRHQLSSQPLVIGIVLDEPGDLGGDRALVAAEVELRVDAIERRTPAQLLELVRSELELTVPADAVEGSAAPEVESRAERIGRLGGVTRPTRLATGRHELGEAPGIEGVRAETQPIAGRCRLDRIADLSAQL